LAHRSGFFFAHPLALAFPLISSSRLAARSGQFIASFYSLYTHLGRNFVAAFQLRQTPVSVCEKLGVCSKIGTAYPANVQATALGRSARRLPCLTSRLRLAFCGCHHSLIQFVYPSG